MITLPANAEAYSALGVLMLLILAWSKMAPALAKISADEHTSLRTDLLERVKKLEADIIQERKDCALALKGQEEKHEQEEHRLIEKYENKLADMQKKLDLLLDALLGTKDIANQHEAVHNVLREQMKNEKD